MNLLPEELAKSGQPEEKEEEDFFSLIVVVYSGYFLALAGF